jgi:Aldo/keto reductase family
LALGFSSAVRVPQICLGTATFGVAPTGQDADRIVGAAIDPGSNFVDTADVYGNMPVFDRPGAPFPADRRGTRCPRVCPWSLLLRRRAFCVFVDLLVSRSFSHR